MDWTSSIGLTVANAHERFREAIFFLNAKTATPFHHSMQVCIKQTEAGKPSSTVVCYFKVSFTIKWKKKEELLNRLTAAILKDFPLENTECSKYQLIFVTAEEVLS